MKFKKLTSLLAAAAMSMSIASPALAKKAEITSFDLSYNFNDGTTTGWQAMGNNGNQFSNVDGQIKMTSSGQELNFDLPDASTGVYESSVDVDFSHHNATAEGMIAQITWGTGVNNTPRAGYWINIQSDCQTIKFQNTQDWGSSEAYPINKAYTIKAVMDLDKDTATLTVYEKGGAALFSNTYGFETDVTVLGVYSRTDYTLWDNISARLTTITEVAGGNAGDGSGSPSTPNYYTSSNDFEDGTKDGWSGGTIAGKLKLDGTGNKYTYTFADQISTGTYTSSIDLDFSNVVADSGGEGTLFLNIGWTSAGIDSAGRGGYRFKFKDDSHETFYVQEHDTWTDHTELSLSKTDVYTMSMTQNYNTGKMTVSLKNKTQNREITSYTKDVTAALTNLDMWVRCASGSYILVDNFELSGTMVDYGGYVYVNKTFDNTVEGWSDGTVEDGQLKLTGTGKYSSTTFDWVTNDFRVSYDVDFSHVKAASGTEGKVFWKASLTNKSMDDSSGARVGWLLYRNDDGTWYPQQMPNWTNYNTQTNTMEKVYTVTYKKESGNDSMTVKIIDKGTGKEIVSQDQWIGGNGLNKIDMYSRVAEGSYILIDNVLVTNAPEGWEPTVTDTTVRSNFDNGNKEGWSGGTIVGGLMLNGTGSKYTRTFTEQSGYFKSSFDLDFAGVAADSGGEGSLFLNIGWTSQDIDNTWRSGYRFQFKDSTDTTFTVQEHNSWTTHNELTLSKTDEYTMQIEHEEGGDYAKISLINKTTGATLTSYNQWIKGYAIKNLDMWVRCASGSYLVLDNFIITNEPEASQPSAIIEKNTFDDGTAGWTGNVTNVGGKIKLEGTGAGLKYDFTDVSTGKVESTIDLDFSNVAADSGGEGSLFLNLAWCGSGGIDSAERAGYRFQFDDDNHNTFYVQNHGNWATDKSGLSKNGVYTLKLVADLDADTADIYLLDSTGKTVATYTKGCDYTLSQLDMWVRCAEGSYILADNFELKYVQEAIELTEAVYKDAAGETVLDEAETADVTPYAEAIELTFNQKMSDQNLSGCITLKDSAGADVAVAIETADKKIIVTPAGVLEGGETYTLRLSPDLYSASGAQLGVARTYKFATGSSAIVGGIESVKNESNAVITNIAGFNSAAYYSVTYNVKNAAGADAKVALIVSYYDANGNLMGMDFEPYTVSAEYDEITLTAMRMAAVPNASSVKVFLWDASDSYAPICENVTLR